MLNYLRIMLAPYLPEREERGASAVEYGLLLAGIAAIVLVAITVLGPAVDGLFSDTASQVEEPVDTGIGG